MHLNVRDGSKAAIRAVLQLSQLDYHGQTRCKTLMLPEPLSSPVKGRDGGRHVSHGWMRTLVLAREDTALVAKTHSVLFL